MMLMKNSNSGLIQLNLSRREKYPYLGEILSLEKLTAHIAAGNIQQINHPDRVTRLYTYTVKCAREKIWDEVTTLCRGIITRNGLVIARPWEKFFQKNTRGMRETEREFWPAETPEITLMLDGEQCVGYESTEGKVCLANRYGFLSSAVGWGTSTLRKSLHFLPEHYTPVMQVVGNQWRRIREYEKPTIYLMTLVNILTGEEMSREIVEAWAKVAGVEVLNPTALNGKSLDEVLKIPTPTGRGRVLKWNRTGSSPFRVIIRNEEYESLRNILNSCTPLGIWDLLRRGAEGEQWKNSLPPEFISWAKEWEEKIEREKLSLIWDARGIWRRLDKDLPQGKLWEQMLKLTEGKEILRPVVYDLMYGRDAEEAGWRASRAMVVGKEGWKGGKR